MKFNKHDEVECTLGINNKQDGFAKFWVKNLKDKVDVRVDIANGYLNRGLNGDKVKIEIIGKEEKYGDIIYQAKVLEIVERNQELYAGHIEQEDGRYFFVSHDKKVYTDFIIPTANLAGAQINDKVVVQIESWEDSKRSPIGKVVEVLGKKGDSRAEMASFSFEKGFKVGFPKEVDEEAVKIHQEGISENDKRGRRDFRDIVTFTIDPFDAKDFDDAISVKFVDEEWVEVGVHIADVSHYLKDGSAMDNEAKQRTTSVYLVDRVVPMLPEVLSNDLCSLVEGVDRLTMSTVFEINKNTLEIRNKWYGETVIHSHKRFTYEDAQEIIVGKTDGPYKNEIITLNEIAKKLKDQRFKDGALSMETEEVKFKLDENGVPVEVIRKVRFDAHKLVEEFMLMANKLVATYISDLGAKTHVGIYRVHDKPDSEKMHNLSIFLFNLGYNAPFKDDTISPYDLNNVINSLEGDPNRTTILNQIIRSQQKAVYTTQNIGHYGLAFKYYSHFTSPIRRYPDVMIHRLMKQYLKGGTTDAKEFGVYEAMCLRCSEREKDASEAERNSIRYKQVEYMSTKIGQEVTCLVSALTNFGVFLEDEYSKCEGLIKFKDLGDEFFKFDEKAYAVIGDRGTIIRMGDVYKCRVEKTDLELKSIDYKILTKVRELGKKKIGN
jgi:ribonuclease R